MTCFIARKGFTLIKPKYIVGKMSELEDILFQCGEHFNELLEQKDFGITLN